jgi:hypothetical protein
VSGLRAGARDLILFLRPVNNLYNTPGDRYRSKHVVLKGRLGKILCDTE